MGKRGHGFPASTGDYEAENAIAGIIIDSWPNGWGVPPFNLRYRIARRVARWFHQDTDHAVAIEREAAAKWHEDKSAQCTEYLAEHPEVGENMSAAIRTEGIVHAVAAQAIRAGEHHEGKS